MMKQRLLNVSSKLATLLAGTFIGLAVPAANAIPPNVSYDPADVTYGQTLGDAQLDAAFTATDDQGNTLDGSLDYDLPDFDAVSNPRNLPAVDPDNGDAATGNGDPANSAQEILVVNGGITIEATFVPDDPDFDPAIVTRQFSVNKRALQVEAPRANRQYGSRAQNFANSELQDASPQFTGLQFNDTTEGVFGQGNVPELDLDNITNENGDAVAVADIGLQPAGSNLTIPFTATPNPNAGVGANYSVSYQTGSLNILKKVLELSVSDSSTLYGAIVDITVRANNIALDLSADDAANEDGALLNAPADTNNDGIDEINGFENDDGTKFDVIFDSDISGVGTEASADTAAGSYPVSLTLQRDGISEDEANDILSNYRTPEGDNGPKVTSGTHNVNPRKVVVTAENRSKTFGNPNPGFNDVPGLTAKFELDSKGNFVLDAPAKQGNGLNQGDLNDALSAVLDAGSLQIAFNPNVVSDPSNNLIPNANEDGYGNGIRITGGNPKSNFTIERKSGKYTVNKRAVTLRAESKAMRFQSENLPSPLTFIVQNLASGTTAGGVVTSNPSLVYTDDAVPNSTGDGNFDKDNPASIPVGSYPGVIRFEDIDGDTDGKQIAKVNSNHVIDTNQGFSGGLRGDLDVVRSGMPGLAWNPASTLTYGDIISGATLNAQADIDFTAVYSVKQLTDGNGNSVSGDDTPLSGDFVTISDDGVLQDPDGGGRLPPGGLLAGTYKIRAELTPSGDDEGSFRPATLERDLTVNKRSLTITAEDKSKSFDTDNPELTMTFGEFIFGENEGDLTEIPDISTPAAKSSAPGNYDINLTGGSDENYALDLVNGTLTINGSITVDPPSFSLLFGESAPDNLATDSLQGVSGVASDDEGKIEVVYTVDFADAGDNRIGGFPIVGADLPLKVELVNSTDEDRLQFYDANLDGGGSIDGVTDTGVNVAINKAPLTATAVDTSIAQNPSADDSGALPPGVNLKVKLEGLVGPDSHKDNNGEQKSIGGWEGIAGVTPAGSSSINVPNLDITTLGDYTIQVDFNSDNYDVTNVSGTLTVELAAPKIALNDLTYGQELTLETLNARVADSGEVEGVPAGQEDRLQETPGDPSSLGNSKGSISLASPPSGSFPSATDSLTVRINYTPPEGTGFRSLNNEPIEIEVRKQKIIVNADDITQTYGEPTPELTATIYQVRNDWKVPTNDDNDMILTTGLIDNAGITDTVDEVFQPAFVLSAAGPASGHRPVQGQLKTDDDGNTFVQPFYDITFGQIDEQLANYDVRYNRELVKDSSDADISDEDNHARDIGRLNVERRELTIRAADATMAVNEDPPEYTNPFGDNFIYEGQGFAPNEGPGVLKGSLRVVPDPDVALTVQNSPIPLVFVQRAFADNYVVSYEQGALSVVQGEAGITLSNLTQEASEDEPRFPTVTTDPAGLNFVINFTGLDEAPSTPGTYPFTVTIDEPDWTGSAEGTLTIQGGGGILITETTQEFDGNPKPVTVLTSPEGLDVMVEYRSEGGDEFTEVPPTEVGRYEVRAVIQDPAFTGTATGTLTITGPAEIQFAALDQTYDGDPKPVAVSTSPSGLDVEVRYDGSLEAPANAGTYNVVATVQDNVFSGEAVATLTINKAQPGILINDTVQQFDGEPKQVSVQTEPAGLSTTVTYDGSTTAPSAVGTYDVEVTASNENYEGTATGSLQITKGDQEISFPRIGSKSLDDSPFEVDVSATSGLEVQVSVLTGPASVDGKTVTLNDTGLVVLEAKQPGNSNWNSAEPVLRSFNVAGSNGGRGAELNVSITDDGSSLDITVSGEEGVTYIVEQATSLTDPQWEEVDTVTGSGSVNAAIEGSAGYFRTRESQ